MILRVGLLTIDLRVIAVHSARGDLLVASIGTAQGCGSAAAAARGTILAILLFFGVLASGPRVYAGMIVVPNANAGTSGNTFIRFPIQHTARSTQVVYAASDLAGIPIGDVITGLAFRLQAGQSTWPLSSRSWTH